MVKQFGSDPQPVLDRFYENCGFPQKPEAPSNTAALERDLKLLLDQDFNEGPESGISRWKGIQVFAIAGGQDKIVPHKLALRQFNNLTLCPDASHSLGFEKSEWCAEQIRRFLDSL
jgi:pimeloyl-ACP methyl ester carboxylesterase